MKKVITICMLIVSLIAGGMTMDAKTTKKKSSHKTSASASQSNTFGIKSFLEKNAGEWDIKPDNKIEATLSKLGFTKTPVSYMSSRPVVKDENGNYITPQGCYCDGSTTFCVSIAYYEKDGVQVSILYSSYNGNGPWFDSVMIVFPSAEKRSSFLNQATGMGFKKVDASSYDLCKGRCIGLNLIGSRTIMMCQDEAY